MPSVLQPTFRSCLDHVAPPQLVLLLPIIIIELRLLRIRLALSRPWLLGRYVWQIGYRSLTVLDLTIIGHYWFVVGFALCNVRRRWKELPNS